MIDVLQVILKKFRQSNGPFAPSNYVPELWSMYIILYNVLVCFIACTGVDDILQL